jgi:hypothetical protein
LFLVQKLENFANRGAREAKSEMEKSAILVRVVSFHLEKEIE